MTSIRAAILAAIVATANAASPPPLQRTLPLRSIADVPLTGGTSRFDYESIDRKTHLLFLAHLGASEVIAFDTRTNRVVKSISGISAVHGVLTVPALGRVYATATGTNEVVAIDESSLKVVARIPGGTYPDGMAFVPRRHKLYVSDEHGDTDTVIDTATEKRTATIALGGEAGNTVYDAVADRIYVNVQTRGDLVAIDPATDRIVSRYPVSGCRSNHGLLVDAADRIAYLACEENATLVVFDLRKHVQTRALSVGTDPDVLAYDPGRSLLYVACESGTVSVLMLRKDGARKLAEAFLAENAHVVGVDEQTHRVYFPLPNVGGSPALRIMVPVVAGHSKRPVS